MCILSTVTGYRLPVAGYRGWQLVTGNRQLIRQLFSIQKIERHAVDAEQVALFAVIGADYHERDLQRRRFLQRRLRRLRHDHAVIARRVVVARADVVLPRARWRQVAMSRSADAAAMSEDREVAGVA